MKKYTKDHEWVELKDDIATIGITNYAQQELGDIVFVECDNIGDKKLKGDVFGTIEAVKTVSDLYSPISGEIIEFNDKIEDVPELVNEDSEGEGWIIKISIDDSFELDELMSEDEYINMINEV